MTRKDDLDSYSARIQELGKTNKALKEKLKDEKSSLESSLSVLQLEKAKLDQLIKDKDTALKSLEEANKKLTLEIEEIKVDRANNWAVEKQKIEEAAFKDGFRSWVKTFMAADPEYNWADKFGEGVAKWMKKFSVMEAAGIAEMKALLETERGRQRTPSKSKCRR